MKEIELTQGMVALVDDEDYELVRHRKWYAHKNRYKHYAEAGIQENGKTKSLKMHRVITGAKHGEIVDHINHDGLDNRRINLRICNTFEHKRRARTFKKKYRGVSKSTGSKTWRVAITVNYKLMHIGNFKTQEEAALAYNEAAIKYHGEYASLNKVGGA